ncbi:MAG: lysophospholipid acyltransferase family protein [Candidatus Eisenbacteria bacterium]|nr:lysophospholipid acyltransferase family protein [Candidatus Eisenbacteria bacterium]
MIAPRPVTARSRQARYVWYGRLGSLLVRLLASTWRIDWEIDPAAAPLLERRARVALAFWHHNILPLCWGFRGREITVLVSESADGEIISQIIHRLGIGTARGSSSRGGLRALLALTRVAETAPVAITPDGPRGPRHQLQPGVLLVAQRAGVPIVPLASGARARKRLRSWDRFLVPLPFARVRIFVGAPISLPDAIEPNALIAGWTATVQEAMLSLQQAADLWAEEAGEP